MSLQHIKLKPLFYLKSKNRNYLKKISKLQQKWKQNSSQSSVVYKVSERHTQVKVQIPYQEMTSPFRILLE